MRKKLRLEKYFEDLNMAIANNDHYEIKNNIAKIRGLTDGLLSPKSPKRTTKKIIQNLKEGKPLTQLRPMDEVNGFEKKLSPYWSSESHFDYNLRTIINSKDKFNEISQLIYDSTKESRLTQIPYNERIEKYRARLSPDALMHLEDFDNYRRLSPKYKNLEHEYMSKKLNDNIDEMMFGNGNLEIQMENLINGNNKFLSELNSYIFIDLLKDVTIYKLKRQIAKDKINLNDLADIVEPEKYLRRNTEKVSLEKVNDMLKENKSSRESFSSQESLSSQSDITEVNSSIGLKDKNKAGKVEKKERSFQEEVARTRQFLSEQAARKERYSKKEVANTSSENSIVKALKDFFTCSCCSKRKSMRKIKTS